MWQLLELYFLPWVVVFSSKALFVSLSFDLTRSSAIRCPAEAVLCSTANFSKVLVLPTDSHCWWMESVYVAKGERNALHLISKKWPKVNYFFLFVSLSNKCKTRSLLVMNNNKDTGSTEFTLHVSSWVHSFFLSGSTTRHCLFSSHSFSMGKKANTGVSEQQQDTHTQKAHRLIALNCK